MTDHSHDHPWQSAHHVDADYDRQDDQDGLRSDRIPVAEAQNGLLSPPRAGGDLETKI